MRHRLSLIAVLAAIVVAAGVSHAQENAGAGMAMDTVAGVLVDTKCYGLMPKENAGNDHMVMKGGQAAKMPSCATACANMGIPVGLKRGNQTTLVLAAPANQLSKHMGEEVKLAGVYSKDKSTFIVTRVIPKKGEPYDIVTMM